MTVGKVRQFCHHDAVGDSILWRKVVTNVMSVLSDPNLVQKGHCSMSYRAGCITCAKISVQIESCSNVISKIKGIKNEINEFVHIVSYEFYLINKKATNFRPVSIICINRTFNMEYGILILHIQYLASFMYYLQPVIYTTLCNLYRYNCSSGHTICWTVYYTVYAHNFTLTEAIEFYSEHEFFVKSSTFKLLTVVIQQRWGFS